MIAPAPFDFDRGKSIRIRQTVHHLGELGYEVDVRTYPTGRAVEDDHVSVRRTPATFAQKAPAVPGVSFRQLLSNVALVFEAVTALRRTDYDVVHAHDVDGVAIADVARRVAGVDTPLVYDMHGTFAELDEHYDVIGLSGVTERLQRYLHETADFLVLNWPHIEDEIDTTTPHTLVMDEPDRAVCERLSALRAGDATACTPDVHAESYVLYTGNYAPYQGVDLLLDAFDELETDGDVQLVLTGDASDAPDVSDPDVVQTGFVDESRLADLLFDADVLVSPRRTDGFPPMKVLYYLRTAAPMVVTDRMCHRTVLEGVPGVTFTAEDPAAFAAAVADALADDARYERRPNAGDTTADYRDLYARVLDR